MDLIKRLEKRARELDRSVSVRGMRSYPQWAADDRELLLEVAEELRSALRWQASVQQKINLISESFYRVCEEIRNISGVLND